MLYDKQCGGDQILEIDGVWVKSSLASERTKVSMHAFHALLGLITQQLGDYGYFSYSGQFFSQGNLFSDFKSLIPETDLTPRQKTVTRYGVVGNTDSSLPDNPVFNSLLASLAPRLTNSYLVTQVVHQSKSCA